MKSKLLFVLPIAALAMSTAPLVRAHGPGDGDKEGAPGAHAGGGKAWGTLDPADREKLQAAHRAAMSDPDLQAAKAKKEAADKEFHDKLQAALLKADPSLQPILDKLAAERANGKHRD